MTRRSAPSDLASAGHTEAGPAVTGVAGGAPGSVRAVVCDGRGGVRVASVPPPRPGPGEVLLRVRRSGICGTDLWKIGQRTAAPGTVLGHEVVGTVVAAGDGGGDAAGKKSGDSNHVAGVALPRPGQRVVAVHHVACGACAFCLQGSPTMCAEFHHNLLAPGGWSDLVVVRGRAAASAIFALPAGLDDEAAVFLEPAACVLRGLARAGLIAGSSDVSAEPVGASAGSCGAPGGAPPPVVAILGGGSMGLLHLLVLRAVAGERVCIAVSEPLAERRALARRLGADAAAAPGEALAAQVLALSQGRGADVAIDTVGGAGLLDEALAVGRAGGTVLLFAHASPAGARGGAATAVQAMPAIPAPSGERGTPPADAARVTPATDATRAGFDLNFFFKTERRLVATYSSGRTEQLAALELLASGRLDPRPLVSHRLPLDEAPAAVALAGSGGALKVLLLPEVTAATAAVAREGLR